MKAIRWMGTSKHDLGAFPPDVRRKAGHPLYRVECGDEPSDWKPMVSVGPGVSETWIHAGSGAFRVVYVATRAEAIYVLHCFQKKTAKTLKKDLALARRRFQAIPDGRSDR